MTLFVTIIKSPSLLLGTAAFLSIATTAATISNAFER